MHPIHDHAQFIAIEIKIGKDKLTPEQQMFLDDVNAAGGIGRVIKTTDDLEKLVNEI